jgi:hypothetical protein
MLFVMSSHKFNGAFIVCLCCILLIKPVRGEGPLPDLNKILVPVETALVVKSKSSERLLVLTIHPDPIPFCSLGYMSIWDFENADAFYAFRNLNQLTGLFPSEGLKSTKHELLQLKLGDSVEVAGSKLRWLPNT